MNVFHPLNRRSALRVGGLGLLGLNMRKLFAAEKAKRRIAPRAKSVVFLFQWGGPSQLDMFDMKPDAPDGIRSPHKWIDTNLPGVITNEHMPAVAKIMKKVTLVRSVHHTMKNHNSAGYYALSGSAPDFDDQRLRDTKEMYPAYGSVVDHLTPTKGDIPTFVAYPHIMRDGSAPPGQHASFLGKAHDPFLFTNDPNSKNFALPELSLPTNIDPKRLASRRQLQQLVDQQSRLLDYSASARGLDAYYERALGMLNSPKMRNAFDLTQEPDKIRDTYGRHTYGQSVLLARRLVEAGTKFVNVYFSDSIGGQSTTFGGWDTHGFNNTRMYPIVEKRHLPITNQTLPTFLNDLDDRGLLDETLVVWMGEFGRTPKINANSSRDHWPQCYTVLLAGGGIKRGYVYGASDKNASYPAENPVRPDDIAATMYQLLGIDPHTEVIGVGDRPLPITTGNAIQDIIG